MKTELLFLALPTLGVAFPGMAGKEDFLRTLKQQRDAVPQHRVEKRQGLLDNVVGAVGGLLGSIAQSVSPDNRRPEEGYEFMAPGPDDSRGPCPGLNLLANHGYLPRDGFVNYEQVVEATSRGFNMGADLSTLLTVFSILANGDIADQSFYLGSGPGNVGGLNRHSTVEADVSPNREDYYLGCGDNHHLSSRLFKQNTAFASEDANNEFTLETMAKQWAANAQFSQDNNPFIYFFPFPSIVALGAYAFYPNFFSNGTYGDGGVANFESISSIIGAKLNEETGEFEYVPERWPENWYRRSTPYGIIPTLTDVLTSIYPAYPLPMAFGQLGSDNLTPQTILCVIYQGLQSIQPLALEGQTRSLTGAITWSLGKLADVGLSDTILGCPSSTLSPDWLVANASMDGGPLNPPTEYIENAGNNVYDQTYFCEAPTEPTCNNECSA